MDYRHRVVLKKCSHYLQQSIDLHDLKDGLRKSKILTVHMLNDIYEGKESLFEELPTRGPEAFYRFINLLKTTGRAHIAEKLCHLADPAYQVSDKLGYYHIILNFKINGIDISEELKKMERGSKSEAVSLDKALLKNGFETHKYQVNLKADELCEELKMFSEKDFSDVNSCIVIMIGFGAKRNDFKVIYGADGKYILLHDILNLFSDTNCPSLKYKPKIFLLPSFDVSHYDSVQNVELLTDVNDTFLCYFPPVKIYNCVNNQQGAEFFGKILSHNFEIDHLKSDFEAILNSSYEKFIKQLQKKDILTDLNDFPRFERVGNCREKILFISKS